MIADLTVAAELERVAERLQGSNLDMLVNNAGFGTPGQFAPVAGYPLQEGMHLLRVVMATLQLYARGARGDDRAARGCGDQCLASMRRLPHQPGSGESYGASKCWINAFTEGIWMELRGTGSPVKVQALCPGFTYSEFHDAAGMDRTKLAPKAWWYPAEQVVEESLAGLERDQIFVIPGWRYRLLVGFDQSCSAQRAAGDAARRGATQWAHRSGKIVCRVIQHTIFYR